MDEKLNKILKYTYTLFCKYGIRSLTMADIARRNMISKKTLYLYVENKADLVDKVLKFNMEYNAMKRSLYVKNANNAIEEIFLVQKRLIKILKNYNPMLNFDLMKYYPQIYQKNMLNVSENIYLDIKRNIKRGQDEGLYRLDLDADLIAKSRLFFHYQQVDNKVVSYKDFVNPHAVKHMMLYHMRAVCTLDGLAKVDKMIDDLKNNSNE